jgi:RimJ/RimL family protein N-acetyltransferase
VTFDANPASARVLEKSGFVFEGVERSAAVKRGRAHDLLVWAQVNPVWRMPENG